jgi:hypothetical protein
MIRRTLAALLLAGALAACGDDNGTGPEPIDVTGTWALAEVDDDALPAPLAGTNLTVDAGTLALQANGGFTFTLSFESGSQDFEVTGSYARSGTQLTFTPAGGGQVGTATLTGDGGAGSTMVLTTPGPPDVIYTFTR